MPIDITEIHLGHRLNSFSGSCESSSCWREVAATLPGTVEEATRTCFFHVMCSFLSHRMGGCSLRKQRSERQQGKALTYVWHCASVMRLPYLTKLDLRCHAIVDTGTSLLGVPRQASLCCMYVDIDFMITLVICHFSPR